MHFKGRMGAKIKPRFSSVCGLCWIHVQLPCPSMKPREEAPAGQEAGSPHLPPPPGNLFCPRSTKPARRGYSSKDLRSTGLGSKAQWQPQGQVEADKCCIADSSGPSRNHHPGICQRTVISQPLGPHQDDQANTVVTDHLP